MPASILRPADFPLARTTLANGLRVVAHVDSRLPLVACNLWYRVGSRDEHPGRTGFAHLFEHMLFQGSAHVGTNDHFRQIQSVGGVANGSTWYDRTNYYETVPSDRLELALWLESDRMGFLLPALDQAKLDTQRAVVLNERRQRVENQPYGRSYERLFELLFPPDHPYHWPVIGWSRDIEAATLDDVRDFFCNWYVPNNAVLTLAGDLDPDAAFAAVAAWFGELTSRQLPERRKLSLAPLSGPIAETVREEVQLARVYSAFRTPPFGTDEWIAASLFAGLLANGKSSPLYREFVWERQLAQDIGIYVYPTLECGVLVAWATVKPGIEPRAVLSELRSQFTRVAEHAPHDELERARNRLLASLWSEMQTVDERADQLSMYTLLCDRPEAAWEEPGRFAACTGEQISAFATTHLAVERGVELTVLPLRGGE